MRQTRGAIVNLLSRYRAVLKKCAFLNCFGSLIMASLLVASGPRDVKADEIVNSPIIVSKNEEKTIDNITINQNFTSEEHAIYNEGILNIKYGLISNYGPKSNSVIDNLGTITIENTKIDNNKTDGKYIGGAIENNGTMNLKNIVSKNNISNGDYNGGSIFNSGNIILIGTNEFKNNKVNNINNDIYNIGNITIDNGITTLGSGYIQDNENSLLTVTAEATINNRGSMNIQNGAIKLNGSLNLESKSSLSINYGSMEINGGTLSLQNGASLESNNGINIRENSLIVLNSSSMNIKNYIMSANNSYFTLQNKAFLHSDNSSIERCIINLNNSFISELSGKLYDSSLELYNDSSIEIKGSEINNSNLLLDNSNMSIVHQRLADFYQSTLALQNSSSLQIDGFINAYNSTLRMNNDSFMQIKCEINVYSSDILLDNSHINIATAGMFYADNGVLTLKNSRIDIENGSELRLNKSTLSLQNGGTLQNEGTVYLWDSSVALDGGTMAMAGESTLSIAGGSTVTLQDGGTLDLTSKSTLSIAGGSTVTLQDGGTLDLVSGCSLNIAEDSSVTVQSGGSLVSDVDLLLNKDYGPAEGITDDSIVGIDGNLNLRLEKGSTYTVEDYQKAKKSLLGQGGEKTVLTFLNAALVIPDGGEVVLGSTVADDSLIVSTTPSMVVEGVAAEYAPTIESAIDKVVKVVEKSDEHHTLLPTDTVAIDNSSFAVKALQVKNAAGSDTVTLNLNGSNLTLAGSSPAETGVVDADGKAIDTEVAIDRDSTLNMGLKGETDGQGLTLTGATVEGRLYAYGNSAENSAYALGSLSMEEGARVGVSGSRMDIGSLAANGGTLFVDPSYVNIDGVQGNGAFGTKLLVSTGSVVNIGAMNEADLRQAMAEAGMTAGPALTAPDSNAVLALAAPLTLKANGRIVADARVDEQGMIDGARPGTAVHFGNGSLLVVDAGMNGAAITADTTTSMEATVASGAALKLVNARENQDVTILSGFSAISGENGGEIGWQADVTNPDRMLTSSVEVVDSAIADGRKDAVVKNTVNRASSVLPGLDSAFDPVMNHLWASGANDVNAADAGIRFLSRAANSDYMPDARRAASTIESAARIAVAGAVPQMTRMSSDAATNAVVNRLGFASPDNGAKAMNQDGQLVGDKALGLALWIAPLWSNQTGFGMEAGNFDLGYRANLGGVSLGVDYTWANNFRAGLLFNIGGGYAETDGGDLSDTTNSMTFWGIGAYGGWEYENFAVMGDVSYTSTWNSVDQDVDAGMGMGALEADIHASALSAGLRLEYKLETSVLDLIPHIGVRYMSINTWGYDVDSSAGTVLEGDGFQQNIWTFPVGITFSRELEMNDSWYFKPSLDFTVIPAAGDIKAKEDVRFTGLPYSTQIETQMMDYFTWQGGVGVEFGNDNMSVGVNYTLQAGRNSTSHGVFGMFRYEF